jgi:trk system potassium uptake protein TrkH
MKIFRPLEIRRATELHHDRGGVPNTPLHVMGIALVFVSIGMFLSAVIEVASTNRDTSALLVSGLLTLGLGAFLWWATRPGSARARDVFAAVGWTWVVITLVGALPFILAGTFDLGGTSMTEQIVNSIFESASGYSCTGSTALQDFEAPGRGLLMYRQATQWYGGMGIVVLAVAVLPFLGVGGLDLMAAEAPGPSSDRLTPRIAETAKRLWATYAVLTVAVGIALFAVPGPSLYDGLAHGLSTASTGGFSPYGKSIGHYDSVLVEAVIIIGMVIGGMNFAHHWRALQGRFSGYANDPEVRIYLLMLAVCTGLVVGLLWLDGGFGFGAAFRAGIFNVVALGTSTGFGNATGEASNGNFVLWIPAAQMILLFLMVVGACTGSTSGGIKVMRVQVLLGHSIRSVRHTQQPRAVIPVRHGRHAVSEDIVSRMAGFFVLYLLLVLSGIVILTGLGAGLLESIGAIVGSLGNMGPALGEAGPTASFSEAFSQPARLVLALFMIIGRLEIFPMMLMFALPARALRERFS